MAFVSSSQVVIVLPVPFAHAVREQKLPRVNCYCYHESAMRPCELPSNDRTQRPFKRSMPCDRAKRVLMPKVFVVVICAGLAMWGLLKHNYSTYSPPLRSISYEPFPGSQTLHQMSLLSLRRASHVSLL